MTTAIIDISLLGPSTAKGEALLSSFCLLAKQAYGAFGCVTDVGRATTRIQIDSEKIDSLQQGIDMLLAQEDPERTMGWNVVFNPAFGGP